MITVEKLKVYEKYSGEGDALLRCGTSLEKALLTYKDLRLIDELLQSIRLIDKNVTSSSFIEGANKKFQDVCESHEVILFLQQLARKNAAD
jgi:hypothetical protein